MTWIEWLDIHAEAVKSIGILGTLVTSAGAWICTVWADRKAKNRAIASDAKTNTYHLEVNSRMQEFLKAAGLVGRAEGIAQERRDQEDRK